MVGRIVLLWAALTAVTTGCLLAVAAAVLAVAGSFAQVCALSAGAAGLAVLATVIALRAPDNPGAAPCAVGAAPADDHLGEDAVRGGRVFVPRPRDPTGGRGPAEAEGAAVPARSGAGTAAPERCP